MLGCFKCKYENCILRPPWGDSEAHLHQFYKPCVIGAIPSQTYEDIWGGFVMALLQCHSVNKLGEDELPKPPWWP